MSLKIIRAGLLDTVQNLGRWGYQHLGINPGGAMDRFSASLANALLGKEGNAPVLEFHFPAPQIHFQKPCVFCLAGANFSPLVNGIPVSVHQPVAVQEGAVLSFAGKKKGARCYLALLNELQLQPWLGSFSTALKAGAGGFEGRKLAGGDEIDFAPLHFFLRAAFVPLHWKHRSPEALADDVEFTVGPEWDWLSVRSQTRFLNEAFTITAAADRMGYRLQGEALEQGRPDQLVSSGVNFGTVQLLPDGQLIVLMADHQTIGGYPRVAQVASADLPKLAQKGPGDTIRFVMITPREAAEKRDRQQRYLQRLQTVCRTKIQNSIYAH